MLTAAASLPWGFSQYAAALLIGIIYFAAALELIEAFWIGKFPSKSLTSIVSGTAWATILYTGGFWS